MRRYEFFCHSHEALSEYAEGPCLDSSKRSTEDCGCRVEPVVIESYNWPLLGEKESA